MNDEQKKTRTPGRKLAKEDLERVVGGLPPVKGCGTQGCPGGAGSASPTAADAQPSVKGFGWNE